MIMALSLSAEFTAILEKCPVIYGKGCPKLSAFEHPGNCLPLRINLIPAGAYALKKAFY